MTTIPNFTSRLLAVALSMLGLLSGGCLTEIYEQAQNAAQRKQTFNELKQLGIAFHNFHDTHRRGPKDWQDFQQFVPAGLQQTLEAQGYQFVFNVAIPEMRIGTSQFMIAFPRDAETAGALVLMGDASVHQLTADEFKQKLAAQNADLAQQQAPASRRPMATTPTIPAESPTIPTQPAANAQATTRPTTGRAPRESSAPPEAFTPPEPFTPSAPFGPASPFGPAAPFGGRPTPGFGAESDPGTPIDNATPLAPGDKVLAKWANKWIPADVVALRGAVFVTVHLESDGFGNKMPVDPTLPRAMLRLPGEANAETTAAPPAASPPAPSSPIPAASAGEFRTWTDASGEFRLDARFVSVADGAVTLEKRGGIQIRMPLEKLSAADRDFITTQTTQP